MSVEPMLTEALTHYAAGRIEQAEALYRAALDVEPDHAHACLNLTRILMLTTRIADAQRWLNWRLRIAPDDVNAHRQLGFAYATQHELALALVSFQHVIECEPGDAGAHEIIAHLLKGFGRHDEAESSLNRSAALREPVQVAYAPGGSPAFRVLMLFAPGAGNTPYFHLLRVVTYDCRVLSFVEDVQYDAAALRASTDVVFNLIADVDSAGALLPLIGPLLTQIGKPVINDPARIALTGREAIAQRLASIDGCLAPQMRRYTATEMQSAAYAQEAVPFSYPVLARRAGTHGGEDFEHVADPVALEAFVEQTPATHYYVSQYVDYRSADGFFRKYRFMFVDGEIFPYHLAIDHQWKIHHATTEMVHHLWMQHEEQAFLENPERVFGPCQYAVLGAIRDAIGLDYWGVDCGLLPDGRVIVFEANATMLVHTRNETFPYKKPAVARIKRAFDAMLTRRAALSARAASYFALAE